MRRRPTIIILLTIIAFAFPLYVNAITLLISGNNSHESNSELFLRHFPSELTPDYINYLTLGLSLLSALLAEIWRRRDNHLGRSIAFLILIASLTFAIITGFKIASLSTW